MKEIWKPIKGYKNVYEVSNLGRVRSVDRYLEQESWNGSKYSHTYKGKVLKQFKSKEGYMKVTLSYKYKLVPKTVHKLVAEAFLDNPNNYPVINHINGNKLDNSVNNLEWCTYEHNNKEAFRLGLNKPTWKGKIGIECPNSKKINQYDLEDNFIRRWDSMRDVQRELNIYAVSISKCCRGISKTAGGFKWRYADE